MKSKKGYVVTCVLRQTGRIYVLRANRSWTTDHPKIFASVPEAKKSLMHWQDRFKKGTTTMKIMSYRDWQKKAVEQEISR